MMDNQQRIEMVKLGLVQLTNAMLERIVDWEGGMLLTGGIVDGECLG